MILKALLILACVLAVAYVAKQVGFMVPFGMTISTTKDTGGIGMGGGNIVYVREVTSAGADLGTPDTNHVLGHMEATDIKDVPTIVKAYAEDAGQTFSGESKRDVSLKFTCMQTDLTHLGLPAAVRGKFYRIYYQRAPLQNGKVQEYAFGICKIIPQLELAFKDGAITTIPINADVLKNSAAITIANNTLPTEKKTSAAMDIGIGLYYFIAET
jgi:hypothetical protein